MRLSKDVAWCDGVLAKGVCTVRMHSSLVKTWAILGSGLFPMVLLGGVCGDYNRIDLGTARSKLRPHSK
jgi:hypothetical protein